MVSQPLTRPAAEIALRTEADRGGSRVARTVCHLRDPVLCGWWSMVTRDAGHVLSERRASPVVILMRGLFEISFWSKLKPIEKS